jgi:uncharacterized protein (DUF779 family)
MQALLAVLCAALFFDSGGCIDGQCGVRLPLSDKKEQ